MRTWMVAGPIGVAVFAAAFFLLPGARVSTPTPAAKSVQAGSSGPLTRRDKGEGAVEIEVTLVAPGSPQAVKYGAATETAFIVSMNTHSVDLTGYDLTKASELVAAGRTLTPIRWTSTSDNSHHRAGVLSFPKVDRSGVLELRIKAIAGVPVRVFRWAP